MQVKFKSIIKRIENLFKNIFRVVHKKDKSPDLALLIPGKNYLKLRSRYYSYKNLLLKNNELLNALSEVEEGIEAGTITLPTFRAYLSRIFDTAFGFIQSLNDMTDNRYMRLYDVLERIREDTDSLLKEKPGGQVSDPVVSVEKITVQRLKDTGGKAANLGEIRNILKLPTPRGFSITVRAYKDFIAFNSLDDRINDILISLDINDTGKIDEASKEIQELIIKSRVPPVIEERIYKEADNIGKQKKFSVRSSAVGEDGKVSFAGQFRSVLNVKRESLITAYKEVIASKYDSRAIFYRMAKGIKDRDVPMSVLVLEMVDARTSGVLYTLNPGNPEKYETIISAVWGLGPFAVNGTILPDMYILDRKNEGEVISSTIPDKNIKLALNPSGGVKDVPVPQENRSIPCLSDHEISLLYNFSRLIEQHFGMSQDIEWAIDEKGWMQIIQSRPLHIKRIKASPGTGTGYEERIIFSGGESASRGIAS